MENKKLKKIIIPKGKEVDLGNVILESGDTFYIELKEGEKLIDLEITTKDKYGLWRYYIDNITNELVAKSDSGLTNVQKIEDIIPDFHTFYRGKIDSDVIESLKDYLTYNPLQ